MKQRYSLFAGLLFASSLFGQEATVAEAPFSTKFELSQGYRNDTLKIKTVGDSKAHFKNIDVYTSRFSATVMKNDFFLKAVAGYGHVYDGKYHETIHSYGHSHSEHHHIHNDYTADFIVEFGKNFAIKDCCTLTPKVGYSAFIQKFDAKEHGNNERFTEVWYSPFIGLNVSKEIAKNLSAFISYDFLFPMNCHTKYREHGDINFSTDNKPYKSFGNIATVGLEWNFAENWSLKPEFEFMKFLSKNGGHNDFSVIKKTTRTAYEARLTLGYSF